MDLTGLHHVTAVSSDIRENHRFYTQVLGMRLVKRSVNQDDVSAYHLFYADAAGSPGTDVTFFDWSMPRERRGTHSLARTYLRVNGRATLEWWEQYLKEKQVAVSSLAEQNGRLTLNFEDTEGMRLALIDDNGQGESGKVWEQSPVPAEHQVRGLGPIRMSVPDIDPTDAVLTSVMNMRAIHEYADTENGGDTVRVYEMGPGGANAEVHVAINPRLPVAQLGAGGVHHVAFRTPNDEEYHAWNERLKSFGIRSSGEIDRYYFRSLYFREPNGILFEIATDGPGFAVDEDAATLGDRVALPPFLEGRREAIVANLKPID
jgi:glyoxalase family protein